MAQEWLSKHTGFSHSEVQIGQWGEPGVSSLSQMLGYKG